MNYISICKENKYLDEQDYIWFRETNIFCHHLNHSTHNAMIQDFRKIKTILTLHASQWRFHDPIDNDTHNKMAFQEMLSSVSLYHTNYQIQIDNFFNVSNCGQ